MHALRWFLLGGAVAVSGCAATNTLTRTGGVEDYGRLSKSADERMLSHVSPRLRGSGLGGARIEAPRVAADAKRLQKVSQEGRQELVAHLGEALTGAATRSPPSRESIVVHSVITDLDTPTRTLNVLTTLVVGPISSGGASVEFSLKDAKTGEELAALVCAERPSMLSWDGMKSAYGELSHSKLALTACVDRLVKLLEAKD
jgi:hypothetical protein